MKFCFEVANLWYEPLLRGFCENRENEKSLEYQGFQRFEKSIMDECIRTPKAGALPTALHPVIQFFIRLGVFSQASVLPTIQQ